MNSSLDNFFSFYYILKDRIPTPCDDARFFSNWMASNDIHVGHTQVGRCEISTVFLGQSCNVPPILFETMCFGGEFDEYQRRYASWEEAEQGHQEMVQLVTLHQKSVLAKRGFWQMIRRVFD